MTDFSIGSVFNRSFSVFFQGFPLFFGLGLLVFLPIIAMGVLISLVGETPSVDFDTQQTLIVVGGVVMGLLVLIAIPITTAALIHGVFRRLRGEAATFSECLQTGFSRFGAVLAYSLVSGIAIGLGTLLCIIPGIILQTMWYVGLPAVVVEKADAFDALRRSDNLTTGHRWEIFGIIFLVGALNQVTSLVSVGLSFPLVDSAPYVPSILDGILSAGVTALGAVFTAVTYHDLRVSKEGIDSDELAAVFD